MIPMGLLGLRSKVALGFTWDSYGIPMGFLWYSPGVPMRFLQNYCIVSLRFLPIDGARAL